MRGFGVTSVSFAVETHLNRIAEVLGHRPVGAAVEEREPLGDTSGNGVALKDPSTVAVTLAAADRVGIELPGGYRAMKPEPRAGELLPEHLVASRG